jgi:hypothetical protein
MPKFCRSLLRTAVFAWTFLVFVCVATQTNATDCCNPNNQKDKAGSLPRTWVCTDDNGVQHVCQGLCYGTIEGYDCDLQGCAGTTCNDIIDYFTFNGNCSIPSPQCDRGNHVCSPSSWPTITGLCSLKCACATKSQPVNQAGNGVGVDIELNHQSKVTR